MYHFFVEQEQIGPETVTVTGSDPAAGTDSEIRQEAGVSLSE